MVIGTFLRVKSLKSLFDKLPCLPARPEPELQRWVYPTDLKIVSIREFSENHVGNIWSGSVMVHCMDLV